LCPQFRRERISRDAPLQVRLALQVHQDQFARPHEPRFGRDTLQRRGIARNRLQRRREALAEPRRGQRRIPVVGRQHGRITAAGGLAIAALLGGARVPVAPAILVAQRLGHFGKRPLHERPVADPQRGTHAPLVAALVEVVGVHFREEFQRARMATPGKR